MTLDLVTGRQPVDPEFREKDLVAWICKSLHEEGIDQVLHPNPDSGSFEEQLRWVLVGNRPSMERVVEMLHQEE